jgi:L-threonylcarbamoyladenylate synthase
MRGMARIREWREEDAASIWDEARAVLLAGGILALPTETFYALSAHPFREEALRRLRALKSRVWQKPILLLVANQEMVHQAAGEVPESALRLMACFWPGPLTIILPARPEVSPLLTGDTGTIGVRQPAQAVICGLLRALGFPVTGTSANRSGAPPLTRAQEVAEEFGDGVDLILDVGPCPGGQPSTVVDVSRAPARLVRPGALPLSALAELLPELRPVMGEKSP